MARTLPCITCKTLTNEDNANGFGECIPCELKRRKGSKGMHMATVTHRFSTDSVDGVVGVLAWLESARRMFDGVRVAAMRQGNVTVDVTDAADEEVIRERLGRVWDRADADVAPRLERLQQEAAEAGDTEQVRLCELALAGDEAALASCVEVLSDALAQQVG